MSAAGERTVRLGVCGLGRAFVLMRASFDADPRFELAGAADPRPEARARFEAEYGAKAHADIEALCADPDIEAIYIASPHEHHAEHGIAAARAGKHLLIEKPLAVTLADGRAVVAAAAENRVHIVAGPSHAFDAPVRRARDVIAGGEFGPVRMIQALNYTDFLYRPRRPEELDDAQGGGVIPSQGAHQVDVVRMLAGGLVRTVRAHAGAWDEARPATGAYAATLEFEGGAFASLTYSGHAHFDSDELLDWHGELGRPKDAAAYGQARRALAAAQDVAAETALKMTRTFGAGNDPQAPAATTHEHFGLVIVSCARADLRPTPTGLMIYADQQRRFEALPVPPVPRMAVLDALHAAVAEDLEPHHDGPWGLATLEVCAGIARAARDRREVAMHLQVPYA